MRCGMLTSEGLIAALQRLHAHASPHSNYVRHGWVPLLKVSLGSESNPVLNEVCNVNASVSPSWYCGTTGGYALCSDDGPIK